MSANSVCMYMDITTLLAFAAVHCAAVAPLLLGAGHAAIDRYLLPAGPTAANPPHAAAASNGWDRQTDTVRHRTIIYTMLHAMQAVLTIYIHTQT